MYGIPNVFTRNTMTKEEMYNQLKEKIFSNQFSPGEWLVERDLCDQFAVSRTPVREVLRQLAADGIVTMWPSKGYSVRKMTVENAIEVFQAREAIEGMSANLACHNGDESFFSQIEMVQSKIKQLDIEENISDAVVFGNELHDAIVAAADNQIITGFYTHLKNQNRLVRNLTQKYTFIEDRSKGSHLVIIEAILKRDDEESEMLMRKHIYETCRALVEKMIGI